MYNTLNTPRRGIVLLIRCIILSSWSLCNIMIISNITSVIAEIRLKNWPLASRLSRSLKVIGTNTDWSATPWLPIYVSSHRPMSYRFPDKRRFRSKAVMGKSQIKSLSKISKFLHWRFKSSSQISNLESNLTPKSWILKLPISNQISNPETTKRL